MKSMLTIVLLLLFVTYATPGFSNSVIATPTIYFSYSSLFDQVCERMMGQSIPLAAKIEGAKRLNDFTAQWQKDSPAFFNTLVARVGRNFVRKEESVALTSCNVPSVSDPVIIPLKRWLVSLGGMEPRYAFSDVVFHELLHRYLNSNFNAGKSALLKKYRNENPQVLAHLHLMALQKMIYTELKRPELISWLDHDYNQLIGGDYKRAWEIVSSIEGYQAFVNELPSMVN